MRAVGWSLSVTLLTLDGEKEDSTGPPEQQFFEMHDCISKHNWVEGRPVSVTDSYRLKRIRSNNQGIAAYISCQITGHQERRRPVKSTATNEGGYLKHARENKHEEQVEV